MHARVTPPPPHPTRTFTTPMNHSPSSPLYLGQHVGRGVIETPRALPPDDGPLPCKKVERLDDGDHGGVDARVHQHGTPLLDGLLLFLCGCLVFFGGVLCVCLFFLEGGLGGGGGCLNVCSMYVCLCVFWGGGV